MKAKKHGMLDHKTLTPLESNTKDGLTIHPGIRMKCIQALQTYAKTSSTVDTEYLHIERITAPLPTPFKLWVIAQK